MRVWYLAEDRKYISALESKESIVLNESIARMLNRWKSKLNPTRGPRRSGGPRTMS